MQTNTSPVQQDGTAISENQTRRGLRIEILGGAFGMFFFSIISGMPLTMCLEYLGASGFLLSLPFVIGQYALALQIPGAFFAERLESRKPFWFWTALPHRLIWLFPVLMLLLMAPDSSLLVWGVIGASVIGGIVIQTGCASYYSWMADLVPDKIRGAFWGRRQSMTMIAFLLGTISAGYALDTFRNLNEGKHMLTGFAFVFGIAMLAGATDLLLHLLIPEPRPTPAPRDQKVLKRILLPLRNRNFLFFTLAMGVWYFASGLVGQYSMVYLKRSFGATYSQLSAIQVSASLGMILSGPILGYISDRVGARSLGILMMAGAPLFGIVWFFLNDNACTFQELLGGIPVLGTLAEWITYLIPPLSTLAIPQPIWMLLGCNLIAAVFYSGVVLMQLNIATTLAPKEGRTMAMAVHWTLVGLLGAPGPLVGGLLMDHFTANPVGWILPTGLEAGFFQVLAVAHFGCILLIALPLFLCIRSSDSDLPVHIALSRLLGGNPLRVMSNVYNIYTLAAPVDVKTRTQAIRELGNNRTAIAVSDLIEKLDDPSNDVREEATYALGQIGTPEAIDALTQKLEDPHTDLAPQIARALRTNPTPRSVDALVRKLDDEDRETLSESARTLGTIGDRRATESLLEVLQKSHDSKVISASSEALARLGELAAIYEILPRMKSTRNPILKRSLTVAVGDLLGEPEGFYKIILKEQQTAGSERERLLKELRKSVRAYTRQKMQDEGDSLIQIIESLETASDKEEIQRAADLLFDLAIGLAALAYGVAFGGDARALVEDLVWRDQRFSVGVWYLDLLRQRWDEADLGQRDMTDMLLGIYFLHYWSKTLIGE